MLQNIRASKDSPESALADIHRSKKLFKVEFLEIPIKHFASP